MRIPSPLRAVFEDAGICPNPAGLQAIQSISLTSAFLDNIGLVAVVCPFGGIGRRAALKMRFRKEFRFESGRGHHYLVLCDPCWSKNEQESPDLLEFLPKPIQHRPVASERFVGIIVGTCWCDAAYQRSDTNNLADRIPTWL
jgi:hypothetical protein